MGDNGRDNGVPGSYGANIHKVMEEAGYTKVLEKSIDYLYVRNDFRSPIFKNDGKPRLMTNNEI